MNSVLSTICDRIKENLGHPVSLLRLLEAQPDIRVSLEENTQNIAASSVVPWHELGTPPVLDWPRRPRGFLMGWKKSADNQYRSFQVTRPEYAEIAQCEVIQDWECDIADVHGFSSSKSELNDFSSTDAMVECNSREMIDSISHEKLAENLAHNEIRIIHNPHTTDHFARYLWDGRLFLMNDGGSHHFAAAKYVADRLEEDVPLRGTLRVYSLNSMALASLCRDFDMFVIADNAEISNAFHEAMSAFRATWLWHHMPRPFDDTRAILLPKDEPRSRCVANTLREAGITDLGAYLTALAAHQIDNSQEVEQEVSCYRP